MWLHKKQIKESESETLSASLSSVTTNQHALRGGGGGGDGGWGEGGGCWGGATAWLEQEAKEASSSLGSRPDGRKIQATGVGLQNSYPLLFFNP